MYSKRASTRRLKSSRRGSTKQRKVPLEELKAGSGHQWDLPKGLRVTEPAEFKDSAIGFDSLISALVCSQARDSIVPPLQIDVPRPPSGCQ